MRRIVLAAAAFCLILAFFFLGAAFAQWEINPELWPESVRVNIAVCGGVASFFVAVMVSSFPSGYRS